MCTYGGSTATMKSFIPFLALATIYSQDGGWAKKGLIFQNYFRLKQVSQM